MTRIYREADGERIEGTLRPVFIRNGRDYYLTDLRVYADGAIYCWEWVDLDGLRDKLRTGWVATSQRTCPDGPEGADSPTLTLNQVFFPKGWPADPGTLVLRNEYPAPITVQAVTYPTVVHAYWALAAVPPVTTRSAMRPDPTTPKSLRKRRHCGPTGPACGWPS